jgi:hypothetical protein
MASLSNLNLIKIILVESDSNDNTYAILQDLQKSIRELQVISVGDLRFRIPNRIERIRICRQEYLLEVRKLMVQTKVDLIVVADLDGMNLKLNSKAISSCFIRDDWDVVTANQKFGYYDLLALRHSSWCPEDVMEMLRKKQEDLRLNLSNSRRLLNRIRIRIKFDNVRNEIIYSKMIRIQSGSPWIEVDSAFGGLAIYKSWIFNRVQYEPAVVESEHVSFNRQIRELGGRIFINPSLINNHFNTYNVNRFLLIRQGRDLFWNSSLYRCVKKLKQKHLPPAHA